MKKVLFILGVLFCLARQTQAQTEWRYMPFCQIHQTPCDIEISQYWDGYRTCVQKQTHHPRYTIVYQTTAPIFSLNLGINNNIYYSHSRCYPKPRPIRLNHHRCR